MIKFSKEHQWINVSEDGTGIVGITQYAANELGEISFIEMPSNGKSYAAGEQLCVVESVKAASDVFMPVACTITEVNQTLENDPSPLNDDPENAGWICKVGGINMADLDGLMDKAAYDAFVS